MKKYLYLLTIVFSLNGFSQWGANINFVSYTLKAEIGVEGATVSDSDDYTGFSIGLEYGFEMDNLKLVAGLGADFVDVEGDGETIITPSVMVSYPISNVIGLKGGFALPTWDVEDGDGIKASLLHLPLGLDYSLSEKISLSAQYSIALGNRFEGDVDFSSDELKFTDNNLRFGVHFNF